MLCPLVASINKCNRELLKLPNDIELTTTTITCKINLIFNAENIGNNFDDFDDIVIGKKYKVKKKEKKKKIKIKIVREKKIKKKYIKKKDIVNALKMNNSVIDNVEINNVEINNTKTNNEEINGIKTNETEINNTKNIIEPIINNEPKEKNNGFRNQVSIIFKSIKLMTNETVERMKKLNTELYEKEKDKQINVKIFSNGSFHITGCKDLSTIPTIFKLLFNKLSKPNCNYVLDSSKLIIENIYDFKIRMININYGLQFNINRENLKNIFIANKHDAKFKPLTHSAVHVKFNVNRNTTTILLFNSGSVTIAGKNIIENLIDSYYELNKFILTNFTQIYTKEITHKILIDLIKKI